MEFNKLEERYADFKVNAFKTRFELPTAYMVGLAVFWALVTAAFAQVRIYVPFTPVPITLQTLAVLCAGVFLGRQYGALSQVFYLAMGAIGLPVFVGGNAGVQYMIGATGGYLVGFVLVAYFVGYAVDMRNTDAKHVFPMMIAGSVLILLLGTIWLSVLLGISPLKAAMIGMLPFLPLDIAKAAAAAGVGFFWLPRTSSL